MTNEKLLPCNCAEIEGENPDCPAHELTINKIAAWEDWECEITALDGFTVRKVARKAIGLLPYISTPPGDDEVERVAEAVHRARYWPGDEARITPFADEDDRSAEYCRRIARAAITAIPSRDDWRDIASAPKNGTKIDVWTILGDRWANAWWDESKQDWLHWWGDSWGGMGAQRIGCAVTHWMPPPQKPSAPEAAK